MHYETFLTLRGKLSIQNFFLGHMNFLDALSMHDIMEMNFSYNLNILRFFLFNFFSVKNENNIPHSNSIA